MTPPSSLATFFLVAIPFYFIGAFPSGRIVAKTMGVDIEKSGSGNVGATNVARVAGKWPGVITLLLDTAKGALAVVLARLFFPSESNTLIGGLGAAAVFGHCFSLPGLLKGGKGVATALGVIAILSPLLAGIALVAFAATATVSGIVSLSSLVAALVVPLIALFLHSTAALFIPLASIALLVVLRHRENLKRLIEGKEKKFSSRGRS